MYLSQGTLPNYIVGERIPKVILILNSISDNIEKYVLFVPQCSIFPSKGIWKTINRVTNSHLSGIGRIH